MQRVLIDVLMYSVNTINLEPIIVWLTLRRASLDLHTLHRILVCIVLHVYFRVHIQCLKRLLSHVLFIMNTYPSIIQSSKLPINFDICSKVF